MAPPTLTPLPGMMAHTPRMPLTGPASPHCALHHTKQLLQVVQPKHLLPISAHASSAYNFDTDHSTTSCQPMDKILGKSIEWFLRYLVFSTSTGIKFRPIKQAFKCVLKQLWQAHMLSNDLKNIPSKPCPITPCGSKVMHIWSCWGRCVPIPLKFFEMLFFFSLVRQKSA